MGLPDTIIRTAKPQVRWQEFDLDKSEWKYRVTKTKTNRLFHLHRKI